MSAFIDSNVFVYALDSREPKKRTVALALIDRLRNEGSVHLSAQVVNEVVSIATRKLEPVFSTERAITMVQGLFSFNVMPNTGDHAVTALGVQTSLGCSWWDSLIIEAALRSGAKSLYSEDLQHGRVIDGRLTIINPFL